MAGDVGVDGGARRSEEWAYEVVRAGREDREAARAGAAEEAQEHGLGAVVAVVRGGDDDGARRGRRGAQRVVADGASPRLAVPAARESDLRAPERDVQRAGE